MGDRIAKVEDGRVTFRYRKPGSSRDRLMTFDVMEFIRRFLQHVLPSGFMKVRRVVQRFEAETPDVALEPVKPLYCPNCGGRLKYQCSILPFQMPPVEDTG